MKNFSEHWAQLADPPEREAGAPGRPGAERTWFGGGQSFVLVALQEPEKICHGLQFTGLQITDDRLLIYTEYKDHRLQITKTTNLPIDSLQRPEEIYPFRLVLGCGEGSKIN